MTIELFSALLLFATATLFTPGPNNIMLMTSGLNFGFARTRPHLFGVSLGFGTMALCVGLGLGAVFKAYPLLHLTLKVAGTSYLLYLAWRIAHAGPMQDGQDKGAPMTFFQAAAYQWVNPKAWSMAVGAMAAFAPRAGYPYNEIIIALVFATLGTVSAGTWAVFGTRLRSLLKTPRALKVFNLVMAAFLVASLFPVFAEVIDYLRGAA